MTGQLADPVDEANRVLAAAESAGLLLRGIGGVAVALRAPTIRVFRPARAYHDIDLAAAGPVGPIEALLVELGYIPATRFNKLNASERLLFHDQAGRRLDVFVNVLRMCHVLDFRERLQAERWTLPLADLLLAKLQIIDLTDRDAQDAAALLADHEVTDTDAGICIGRIVSICRADWGWWRTVDDNLARLIARWLDEAAIASDDAAFALRTAVARASRLREHLDSAPKSVAWRARALVGERLSWYQEPEEIR